MLEHSGLVRRDENEIRYLRISRAEALNALNRPLLSALASELEMLSKTPGIRALVITGEGEKAFCAGADLKERRDMTLEQTRDFVQTIGRVFRQLELVEIPTVAAINGVAFGGGLELALACDFRFAVKNAKMGLTECALGIMPGAGGTQRLPAFVGPTLAKEMIFGARILSANEAKEVGLVRALGDDVSEMMQVANALISSFKRCAPLSLKAAKRAIDGGFGLKKDLGLELEWKAYETLIGTEDRVEGLKAFAEKRTPKFLGR